MSKRILIVEDDKDILMTVQELIESEGYQVETAVNGSMALQYLKGATTLPHLIILDYMMPVMDGPTFRTEQLKDPRLASIPVLLMTADQDAETKKVKTDAFDFIRKPLDIDQFLSAIANCIPPSAC